MKVFRFPLSLLVSFRIQYQLLFYSRQCQIFIMVCLYWIRRINLEQTKSLYMHNVCVCDHGTCGQRCIVISSTEPSLCVLYCDHENGGNVRSVLATGEWQLGITWEWPLGRNGYACICACSVQCGASPGRCSKLMNSPMSGIWLEIEAGPWYQSPLFDEPWNMVPGILRWPRVLPPGGHAL